MEIMAIIPFEIYYFNDKLNFYEPLIEKTILSILISEKKSRNRTIELQIDNSLDVNISVALYSTIFDMTTTLHEEKELYLKIKENK